MAFNSVVLSVCVCLDECLEHLLVLVEEAVSSEMILSRMSRLVCRRSTQTDTIVTFGQNLGLHPVRELNFNFFQLLQLFCIIEKRERILKTF